MGGYGKLQEAKRSTELAADQPSTREAMGGYGWLGHYGRRWRATEPSTQQKRGPRIWPLRDLRLGRLRVGEATKGSLGSYGRLLVYGLGRCVTFDSGSSRGCGRGYGRLREATGPGIWPLRDLGLVRLREVLEGYWSTDLAAAGPSAQEAKAMGGDGRLLEASSLQIWPLRDLRLGRLREAMEGGHGRLREATGYAMLLVYGSGRCVIFDSTGCGRLWERAREGTGLQIWPLRDFRVGRLRETMGGC